MKHGISLVTTALALTSASFAVATNVAQPPELGDYRAPLEIPTEFPNPFARPADLQSMPEPTTQRIDSHLSRFSSWISQAKIRGVAGDYIVVGDEVVRRGGVLRLTGSAEKNISLPALNVVYLGAHNGMAKFQVHALTGGGSDLVEINLKQFLP
ncbi:MAG: hypothetical protein ACQKBV_12395 [Puniceicoccales bacterium]